MRQEGQDKPILTVPNANFDKGKFYTIVVTGRAKGIPKLQALMVEDQLSSAATASTGLQEKKMVKTKLRNILSCEQQDHVVARFESSISNPGQSFIQNMHEPGMQRSNCVY